MHQLNHGLIGFDSSGRTKRAYQLDRTAVFVEKVLVVHKLTAYCAGCELAPGAAITLAQRYRQI